MRELTAILCLTLAVLLFSGTEVLSADLQKGTEAAQRGDFATALREWTPFAKQGHVDAQFAIGFFYANGLGVPKNKETAVMWFGLAAKQGHADAQYHLGMHYDLGLGAPKNEETALKWFRLAAEQGQSEAQFKMGESYKWGRRGVLRYDNEAVKWFKHSAEQGYIKSQYWLASMYKAGDGVPQDYIKAHMWWNIAAALGDCPERTLDCIDSATMRAFIAEEMTPSQITKAQDLARECIRNKHKGC